MTDMPVQDLRAHARGAVSVRGWPYPRPSSGKLYFLERGGGTGTVQCVVFKGNVSPETFQLADHIQQESSLEVTGTVKEHGRIQGQYEIDVKEVKLLAAVAREYPIGPKEHGTDFLMDNRHLW